MLFDIQMYFTWSIGYCKVRPILSNSSAWRVFKYLNQLSIPTVDSTLNNYKDMLCGSIGSYSYDRQKIDEEKIEKAVSHIFSDGIAANEEAATPILGILFPKTEAALGSYWCRGRLFAYECICNNSWIFDSFKRNQEGCCFLFYIIFCRGLDIWAAQIVSAGVSVICAMPYE